MEQMEMVRLAQGYDDCEMAIEAESFGIHIECIIPNPAYNELGFLLGGVDGKSNDRLGMA